VPTVNIFQIYYSAETRAQLDPGYTPLDNSANERPDWREYWPIRRQLRQRMPPADDYCGFLSPAFHSKTRLTSKAVFDFVNAQQGKPDVVLFSPFFDQLAFFVNQWEQGAMSHRNSVRAYEQCLALVAPGFDLRRTVTSSRNSVFCNYFVATGRFWGEWLERCERIFDCAERGGTELARLLTAEVAYTSAAVQAKVFMIERVASAILATQRHWTVAAYNPMLLPFSQSPVSKMGAELAALDALKIAYQSEPHAQYLQAFLLLRAHFASTAQQRQ
jgi:hypothetical protein